MNKAFEKILERLEELIEKSYYKATEGSHNACIRNSAYHKVKKIVHEVSEEFATDTNVGTNGWIPCSEKLPEKTGWYLVSLEDGIVSTGHLFEDNSWREAKGQDVIAWQPLTEPYQPKESRTNADRIRSMNDEELAKFLLSKADTIRSMNDEDLAKFLANYGMCELCEYNLMEDCMGQCCEKGFYKWIHSESED